MALERNLRPEDGHALSYIDVVTRQFDILLDEYGQPMMTDPIDEQVIDVTDSWLSCEKCGHLGYDELEDHGINPDWQAP